MFSQALGECLESLIVRSEVESSAVAGNVHQVEKLFDTLIRFKQTSVLKGLGVGRTEPRQQVVIAHGHIVAVLTMLGGVDVAILEQGLIIQIGEGANANKMARLVSETRLGVNGVVLVGVSPMQYRDIIVKGQPEGLQVVKVLGRGCLLGVICQQGRGRQQRVKTKFAGYRSSA
ncbi:hypothetical protein BJP24_21655 [Aeromonas allosaccharophila]|nr:hypothetical protein BJP24_21655 [Aeromonas allosaccharophila]